MCTSTTAYTLQFYATPDCKQPQTTPTFDPPGVCGSDPLGMGLSGEITCVSNPNPNSNPGNSGGGGNWWGSVSLPVAIVCGVLALLAAVIVGCCCRKMMEKKLHSLEQPGGKEHEGYYSAQQQLRTQYMPPQQGNLTTESIQ